MPKELLRRVDRRARERKVSRNRYIIEALERTLDAESEWPAEFLERLAGRAQEPVLVAAVDDMVTAIEHGRRSKRKPPVL